MDKLQNVIAKRMKWHLILGAFGPLVLVYPCAVGVSYEQSPIGYWLCKVFLIGFVLPFVAYCAYLLKHQNDAIVLCSDELIFATMSPGGRSAVAINEIRQCTFESFPEVHDHLILSVSEACYQRECRSRTWVACCNGQLRFDMMYTVPSLRKVVSTIHGMIDASPQFGEQGNTPESPGGRVCESKSLSATG
jgi:hypothetical protein